LLQYSGRVTAPVTPRRRFWVGITLRVWRDPGRPTQQWLSTTADLAYRFGRWASASQYLIFMRL